MADIKQPIKADVKQPLKKDVKHQSRKDIIDFPFTRENYILMFVCIALLIIGFGLMSGGGEDPVKYDPGIFSTRRRIVIAPIVVVAGFIVGIFAIMKRPKD